MSFTFYVNVGMLWCCVDRCDSNHKLTSNFRATFLQMKSMNTKLLHCNCLWLDSQKLVTKFSLD